MAPIQEAQCLSGDWCILTFILITIHSVYRLPGNDLISEHALISEHSPPPPPPPPLPHFVLVKTIARAHRDLCVLAVLLCCIMQSIFDAN